MLEGFTAFFTFVGPQLVLVCVVRICIIIMIIIVVVITQVMILVMVARVGARIVGVVAGITCVDAIILLGVLVLVVNINSMLMLMIVVVDVAGAVQGDVIWLDTKIDRILLILLLVEE